MALEIDHLIQCVTDLDAAAIRYRDDFGLESVVGGRHTGHGTGNRILPLGEAYVELVAVLDPAEAQGSEFASWVTGRAGMQGFDGLCIRTDDLVGVSRSRGLDPTAMSRKRPDGVELGWRMAGVDEMLTEGIPFFIQWDVEDHLLPGRTETNPPNPADGFDHVVIAGRRARLDSWIGDCDGLKVIEGEPAVVSAVVQGVELT